MRVKIQHRTKDPSIIQRIMDKFGNNKLTVNYEQWFEVEEAGLAMLRESEKRKFVQIIRIEK